MSRARGEGSVYRKGDRPSTHIRYAQYVRVHAVPVIGRPSCRS